VSISGKGNFYDNAAVETFFKTIKAELIWRYPSETRRKAEMAIFEYFKGFYNPRLRRPAPAWKAWSVLKGKRPKQALEAVQKRERSKL
jgi:putative transposase